MKAIDELQAYSYLLEMNANPAMQVLGKRLGEIAEDMRQIPKPPPITYGPPNARVPSDGITVKHYAADGPSLHPKADAALLLKEMADWWNRIKSAHAASQLVYDELRDLTRRAFNIVGS